MRILIFTSAVALVLAPLLFQATHAQGSEETPIFIGSKACQDCHEEIYERFVTHSKKPHSWKSVDIMKSNLKPFELQECYDCHTTGHGQPGGFVSFEETPHLAEVGCETCHGAGSLHAETGDAETITRLPTIESCEVCHNSDRVEDFNFKPLLYSGAH